MPNWCNNTATIKHPDPEVIAKITEAFEAGGFLQAIVPMPAELENTTSPSTKPNWYDWCVEHWGIKWDIGMTGEYSGATIDTISPNEIQINFESAWSPPIEAYQTMVNDLGYEVTASFLEMGMCFIGTFEDGVENTITYTNLCDIPYGLAKAWNMEEMLRPWDEED